MDNLGGPSVAENAEVGDLVRCCGGWCSSGLLGNCWRCAVLHVGGWGLGRGGPVLPLCRALALCLGWCCSASGGVAAIARCAVLRSDRPARGGLIFCPIAILLGGAHSATLRGQTRSRVNSAAIDGPPELSMVMMAASVLRHHHHGQFGGAIDGRERRGRRPASLLRHMVRMRQLVCDGYSGYRNCQSIRTGPSILAVVL